MAKLATRAERGAREADTPPGAYRLYGEVGCAHGVEKNARCRACARESGRPLGRSPSDARVLGVKLTVQR